MVKKGGEKKKKEDEGIFRTTTDTTKGLNATTLRLNI